MTPALGFIYCAGLWAGFLLAVWWIFNSRSQAGLTRRIADRRRLERFVLRNRWS